MFSIDTRSASIRGIIPNCEIRVSATIRQISRLRAANPCAAPSVSRLYRSELARNTTPEIMPIQCRISNERPTTDPARFRAGSTAKAVCATTGKNISPPSHTIRASNMRKRRNDMAEDYYERRRERKLGRKTENQDLATDL